MRLLKILGVCLIVAALALVGAVYYAYSEYMRPGPLAEPQITLIPDGASLGEVARQLEADGLVRSADLFKWGTRLQGAERELRAGEYEIPGHANMAAVLDILRFGDVVQYPLTIPEGLSSAQVVALLNEAEALEGDVTDIPPEGTLLPETYLHVRGVARSEMIARMQAAFDETLARLWEGRDPDAAPQTPEEAVILASIVEKETAVPEERPRVAAVFLNRLRKGMRLQSDPTVVYAVTDGFPIGRRITRADLRLESPYNTYRNFGLPPGPIANPGPDSLKAVLNPIQTDDYYFVADGTGGHAFARTLEEHNRNVAKWRKIRRARDAIEEAADGEADDALLGGQAGEEPIGP